MQVLRCKNTQLSKTKKSFVACIALHSIVGVYQCGSHDSYAIVTVTEDGLMQHMHPMSKSHPNNIRQTLTENEQLLESTAENLVEKALQKRFGYEITDTHMK